MYFVRVNCVEGSALHSLLVSCARRICILFPAFAACAEGGVLHFSLPLPSRTLVAVFFIIVRNRTKVKSKFRSKKDLSGGKTRCGRNEENRCLHGYLKKSAWLQFGTFVRLCHENDCRPSPRLCLQTVENEPCGRFFPETRLLLPSVFFYSLYRARTRFSASPVLVMFVDDKRRKLITATLPSVTGQARHTPVIPNKDESRKARGISTTNPRKGVYPGVQSDIRFATKYLRCNHADFFFSRD